MLDETVDVYLDSLRYGRSLYCFVFQYFIVPNHTLLCSVIFKHFLLALVYAVVWTRPFIDH